MGHTFYLRMVCSKEQCLLYAKMLFFTSKFFFIFFDKLLFLIQQCMSEGCRCQFEKKVNCILHSKNLLVVVVVVVVVVKGFKISLASVSSEKQPMLPRVLPLSYKFWRLKLFVSKLWQRHAKICGWKSPRQMTRAQLFRTTIKLF